MKSGREHGLYVEAHRALVCAELPASTVVVGDKLLVLAGELFGNVNLSWEGFGELTGCHNANAARRHLSRLRDAGIIHYSTDAYIYVTFTAWVSGGVSGGVAGDARVFARPRAANSAPARICNDEDEAEVDLFGASEIVPALQAGESARRNGGSSAPKRSFSSHARVFVCLSDPLLPEKKKDNKQTNTPEHARDAQLRAVALLTDEEVGLHSAVAWKFARQHDFDWLLRQVVVWRRQLDAGIVRDCGALVHRIRNGFGCCLSEADRRSALYRRHAQIVEDESMSYRSLEDVLREEREVQVRAWELRDGCNYDHLRYS